MSDAEPDAQTRPTKPRRPRLGWLLLANGFITEGQLADALDVQRRTGRRLGDVLVSTGVVSTFDLARVLALHFDLPFLDLSEALIDTTVQDLLPAPVVRRNLALPIAFDGQSVVVGITDPWDEFAIDDVRAMIDRPVELVMVERHQLVNAIARVYGDEDGGADTTGGAVEDAAAGHAGAETAIPDARADADAPVVGLDRPVDPESAAAADAPPPAGADDGFLEEPAAPFGGLAWPRGEVPLRGVADPHELLATGDEASGADADALGPERDRLPDPADTSVDLVDLAEADLGNPEPGEVFDIEALEDPGGAPLGPDTWTAPADPWTGTGELRPGTGPDAEAGARDGRESEGALPGTEFEGPTAHERASMAFEFVDSVLSEAMELGASDVHFDPLVDRMRVRFRVDGALRTHVHVPPAIRDDVVDCLKALAGLPYEERRPQEGHFHHSMTGDERDAQYFSLITLPAARGEAAAVHLPDAPRKVLELDALGLGSDSLERVDHALQSPEGAILFVGTPGSGRSTALHAALRHLDRRDRNVITIEDRVTSLVEGVKQIEMDRDAGLTAAGGLHTAVRADADVVFVDPLDGSEATAAALDAALTGHLVVAAARGDRAATLPVRLLALGLDPFAVATGLRCVIAQRLVRALCLDCAEAYEPSLDVLCELGWPEGLLEDGAAPTLRRPAGCPRCDHTGYVGRLGLFEVMPVTERITSLVLGRAPFEKLERAAVDEGMESLRAGGFRAVAEGVTSLAELVRLGA